MSDRYEMVIGLEVHCELSTATKLFCGCPNAFGDEPNTNICPVCLGLPGSLPVLNVRAVELAMRLGTALHATVQASQFHRKNYFYPDMPKDYQISQYDVPINAGGYLELPDGFRVGITRAHLEEDTGKTTHVGGGGRIHDAEYSLVDYNRSGVPLVEIVSEPDIRSADQARAYVSELRAILVATGVSDGRMEEGSMRCDANVSIRTRGTEQFGTRCEIKNMNSLRSLGQAIEYEAARQEEILDIGGTVSQETRHWNEAEGRTHSLRSKEEAYDYRYFPEPDLVPVDPSAEWIARVAPEAGMLPAERRHELMELASTTGLDVEVLRDQITTVVGLGLDGLVLDVVGLGSDFRLGLARTANEAAAEPDKARLLDRANFAALLQLESKGTLSATQSKAVLAQMLENGGEPEEIARGLGIQSLGSGALEAVLDEVVAANPAEWQRYLDGDEKVIQFLLGQVMRATKGNANGKLVSEGFAARKP